MDLARDQVLFSLTAFQSFLLSTLAKRLAPGVHSFLLSLLGLCYVPLGNSSLESAHLHEVCLVSFQLPKCRVGCYLYIAY